MADIAKISLEIDSAPLQRGVAQARRLLEELSGAAEGAGKGVGGVGAAGRRAAGELDAGARSALRNAQALAALQRATGDYTGAVRTLTGELSKFERGSTTALRIQAQIAQVQNQAKRAGEGTSFKGFGDGLKNAETQLDSLANKLRALQGLGSLPGLGGLGRIAGDASNASSGLQQLASAGTAAGRGIGAVSLAGAGVAGVLATVAGAGIAAAKSTAEYGREVEQASRITGASTTTIQALAIQAGFVGQNMKDVIDAVNQFSTQLGDARNGSKELASEFSRLGVTFKDTGLTVDAALNQAFIGLSRLPGGVEKATASARGFGEEGSRLILSLRGMEGGLKGVTTVSQNYGRILDQSAIAETKRFSENLALLGAGADRATKAVGSGLIPILNSFLDIISSRKFLDGLDKTRELLNLSKGEQKFQSDVQGAFKSVGVDVEFDPRRATTLNLPGLPGFGKVGQNLQDLSNPLVIAKIRQNTEELARAIQNKTDEIIKGAKDEAEARRRIADARKTDPILDAAIKEKLRLDAGQRAIQGVLSPKQPSPAREVRPLPGLNDFTSALPILGQPFANAAKLGAQSQFELRDSIAQARSETAGLNAQLAILSPQAQAARDKFEDLRTSLTGRELTSGQQAAFDRARDVAEKLTRKERELTEARRDSIAATAQALGALGGRDQLPENLIDQAALVRSLPATEIPGIGNRTTQAMEKAAKALEIVAQRQPSLREEFFGRRFVDEGGFNRREEGASDFIIKDFIRGLASGREGIREAASNLVGNFADFLADFSARKINDILQKQLESTFDRLFDFLGGVLGKLFNKIKGKLFDPLGDFFGGLFSAFGGFRADGGPIAPGRFYVVGEKGPELFASKQSGQIIPNGAALATAGGGGSANVTVNIYGVQDIQSFRRNSNEINRQIAASVEQGNRMRGAR